MAGSVRLWLARTSHLPEVERWDVEAQANPLAVLRAPFGIAVVVATCGVLAQNANHSSGRRLCVGLLGMHGNCRYSAFLPVPPLPVHGTVLLGPMPAMPKMSNKRMADVGKKSPLGWSGRPRGKEVWNRRLRAKNQGWWSVHFSWKQDARQLLLGSVAFWNTIGRRK